MESIMMSVLKRMKNKFKSCEKIINAFHFLSCDVHYVQYSLDKRPSTGSGDSFCCVVQCVGHFRILTVEVLMTDRKI